MPPIVDLPGVVVVVAPVAVGLVVLLRFVTALGYLLLLLPLLQVAAVAVACCWKRST